MEKVFILQFSESVFLIEYTVSQWWMFFWSPNRHLGFVTVAGEHSNQMLPDSDNFSALYCNTKLPGCLILTTWTFDKWKWKKMQNDIHKFIALSNMFLLLTWISLNWCLITKPQWAKHAVNFGTAYNAMDLWAYWTFSPNNIYCTHLPEIQSYTSCMHACTHIHTANK